MKLQIEKLVYGGAGRAHGDAGATSAAGAAATAGRTVLVPLTLPGEVVEATLAMGAGGIQGTEHAEAVLLEVLEASPERVAAGCRHFGTCGGCQLQHGSYAEQLRTKAEVLRDTLESAGVNVLAEMQVHAGEPWGYRNRVRLRVAAVEGRVRVGYNRRGGTSPANLTNRTNPASRTTFLPVEECPIAAPLLWDAAAALLRLAEEDQGAGVWLRAAVEVEFFCNAEATKLQMTLFVRKPLNAGFEGLCKRLKQAVPELVGAGVSILPVESSTRSRRMERPVAGAGWGAPGMLYGAAGREYWVSRGGFFQVNRLLVDTMVRVVTAGRKGRLAWDLYAGVGLFSRGLAEGFEQVVAVEGGETAAADLAQGMKAQGMKAQGAGATALGVKQGSMVAVRAATLEFLQAAVIQRERPELIVMDPPRAGVGAAVCGLLVRLKVAELVYVSCDPVTLARDLKLLVDAGYRVVELHLVDMFPQTFHLETIAVLRR